MFKSKSFTVHTIITVLIVVFIGLMYVPYFSCATEECSLAGFVWLPTHHSAISRMLMTEVADYNINMVVLTPVYLFLIGIGTIIIGLKFNKSYTSCIFAICWGLLGIIGYLTVGMPYLILGGILYYVSLVIMAAVLGLGIYNIINVKKEKDEMYA